MGQRHSGGGGAQQIMENWAVFDFHCLDEAGNVLAKALGVSRDWSEVQGTTNCKTSSIQRPGPAFSEARRVVWCGAVVQKC
jgi:hypothetical protein